MLFWFDHQFIDLIIKTNEIVNVLDLRLSFPFMECNYDDDDDKQQRSWPIIFKLNACFHFMLYCF